MAETLKAAQMPFQSLFGQHGAARATSLLRLAAEDAGHLPDICRRARADGAEKAFWAREWSDSPASDDPKGARRWSRPVKETGSVSVSAVQSSVRIEMLPMLCISA